MLTVSICACKSDRGFEIGSEQYSDHDESQECVITITYPVLQSKGVAAKRINDALYAQTVGKFLEDTDNTVGISSDFRVALNDGRYLSVVIKSDYYSKAAAYPSSDCYAMTFDVATGDEVLLLDIVSYDEICEKFANDEFSFVYGVNDVNELSPLALGLWWISFGDSDFGDVLPNIEFYLSDGKVALIFPLNHASGDYAILETENLI